MLMCFLCARAVNFEMLRGPGNSNIPGISTRLSIAGSSGGGNQTCSSTLVLFPMYTLEILGRGNQP